MHILVVDDTEDSRDIAEAALLSAGYADVHTAGSALEAYHALGLEKDDLNVGSRFDLVLLDIVMPEIDGIEACARIRSDQRYTDVPVIMVTALGDIDSLSNAFVAGATDYITKPLNRTELLARVRSALKLKAELDRRHERERELLSFLSTWGDRRADVWVDEATGLLVGEVAEAYLAAASKYRAQETISVVAVAIDRFDAYRTSQGDFAARAILAKVASAVRRTTATVGSVAAAYRNGIIIVVLPGHSASEASRVGELLRQSVSSLRIANSEAIAADYVTVSVVVVSGGVQGGIERARILSRALSAIRGASVDGSNQLIAMAI